MKKSLFHLPLFFTLKIPIILISIGCKDDLNQASILQTPVNIRPENVNNWDYVDI